MIGKPSGPTGSRGGPVAAGMIFVTKGWHPRKQAHPIDPCTGPVAHVQKLAHRHVERLNVLRTWRRAQVGRARCHGRGMGNLADTEPARWADWAGGCVGSAAQRSGRPAGLCAASDAWSRLKGTL